MLFQSIRGDSSHNRAHEQAQMRFPGLLEYPTAATVRFSTVIENWKLISLITLLTALLVAGFGFIWFNYYIATSVVLVGGSSDQTDVIAARGDLETYTVKLRQLAAHSARLDAELANADTITFPADLLQEKNRPEVQAILEGEQLTLAAHRRALNEKLAGLRKQRDLLTSRVGTLEEQVRLAKVQTESIDEETQGVKVLVDKQLAATSRLLDLARTAAIIVNNKLSIESDLLRTRQAIEQTDLLIADAKNERETAVLQEREEVLNLIRENVSRRNTAASIASKETYSQRFEPGDMANEIDVIMSDALTYSVAQKLGLDKDATFLSGSDLPAKASQADRLRAAARILQNTLTVKSTEPGSRLEISYRSSNPGQAARVANAVAEVYVGVAAIEDPEDQGADIRLGRGSHIVRIAQVPEEVAGPGMLLIVSAGAVLGLTLGLGLVLLGEAFRNSGAY